MSTPNSNRNAISAPAASAAGQLTVPSGTAQAPAGAGAGPMGVSALAEALENYAGQAGTELEPQVPPGDDPGREAAAQPEAGAAAPEDLTPPENQPENPELEPEPGELEAEPGAETRPDPEEELSPGLKKRIGKLQAQIRELSERLEASAAREPEPEPERGRVATALDKVQDVAELERRQQRAEEGLDEVDRLLARLPVAPQAVERYLRSQGVKLTSASGEDDYSPEAMEEALANARQSFRQTLRDIPRRARYLADYAQAHAQVVKALPWVGDPTDVRYAEMQKIARRFPSLTAMPNWEYWTACAMLGHQGLQARTRAPARTAANGAKPTTPLPRGGGGAVPPRGDAKAAQLKAARERVTTERTREALAGYLEQRGITD